MKHCTFDFPGHGYLRMDFFKPVQHFLPCDYANCVGNRNGGDPAFARYAQYVCD